MIFIISLIVMEQARVKAKQSRLEQRRRVEKSRGANKAVIDDNNNNHHNNNNNNNNDNSNN